MSYTSDHDSADRKSAERGAAGDPDGHPGAASLQRKASIDAGLTGDKVAGMDLAASPLGTDDEAGGGSAASDPSGVKARPGGSKNTAARDPNRANAAPPGAPWIWVAAAVAAAAALGFALLLALT